MPFYLVRWTLGAALALAASNAGLAQPLVYSQSRSVAAPDPTTGGRFGTAVAVLGDVDGDGRSDYAVSSPGEGRVLVLSGADGATLRAVSPGEAFAPGALAAPGDLDGDRRPDLVVFDEADAQVSALSGASGAPLWSTQISGNSPTFSVGGGAALAVLGDVDGDGRPDVALGVPEAETSPRGAGRVYVLSGSTGATLYATASPGPEHRGGFGAAIAPLGDVDSDGRPDFAVGAPGETAGGAGRAGRAHVVSGADGRVVRTLTAPTPTPFAEFGSALARVVVGGETRLVVGAPADAVETLFGPERAGRVYVVAPASGEVVFATASHLATGSARFGASVAALADVDGDGQPEVAVGEPGQGRAYVLSAATGRPVGTLTAPAPFSTSSGFGSALGAGDLDGDGHPDLLVGAPDSEVDDMRGAGRAYVVSFRPARRPDGRAVLTPTFGTPSGQFSRAVAAVPDVNGDGRPEVAVGAPGELSAGGGSGRVYVVDPARGALLRSVVSPSGSPSRSFGTSVAGTCDLNGDGAGDLAVGAPTESVADEATNGAFGAGRAYLLSGADGSVLRAFVSPQPEGNGEFGQAVAALGDVDGDGRCDVVVGAPGEFFNTGRAYVFSGATGAVLRTLDSPIVDRNPGARAVLFGSAVAGAGDVNGDGRPDLVVGAPRAQEDDTGTLGAGRAFILSGADGSVLHRLQPSPTLNNTEFGSAVAGIGDLDGDGRPDVAVGAYSFGFSSLGTPGQAYAFSGASGAALLTLDPPEAVGDDRYDGRYGWSVVGVGDVDGDGRADLAVGAPGEGGVGSGGGEIGSGQGRVYVHSGADGSVLARYESLLADYTPGQSNVQGGFGASLAAADLDGDGRAEVVVGASSEGAGNVERAGRAYVFSAPLPTATDAAGAGSRPAVGLPYPNPARVALHVPVVLSWSGSVRVAAYDVLGRAVGTAVASGLTAGAHVVSLPVSGWAPGTYVLRVDVGDGAAHGRRVVVVR